jgi:fatty acid desaturase
MDTRTTLSDLFTREEITELTTPSDWHGYWAVLSTWGVIFATFTIVALTWDYLPSLGKILLYIFALIILAGRQLALAILMHDASHQSLFKTKFLNNIVTDWLCARPIWNDLHKYRKHHLRHHSKTSTQADPDLSLVSGYPTTKKSLIFKFLRDLSGMTGLKFVLGRILMDAEKMEWTVSNDQVAGHFSQTVLASQHLQNFREAMDHSLAKKLFVARALKILLQHHPKLIAPLYLTKFESPDYIFHNFDLRFGSAINLEFGLKCWNQNG